MDWKHAEQRTAHTLCKKSSQTRGAAATWHLAIKLPLILQWLLIYLPHMLWLSPYFAGLPPSLCFSSSVTHGLLLLSLFESQAVPLFPPGSSSQSQPSPLHHPVNPPMLDFNFLLMSIFSPAHGSCIMSWKTLLCSRLCKGCLQRSSSFIHSVLDAPFLLQLSSLMWQETAVCVEGSLFLELNPLPFLEIDLSVTLVVLKSPGFQ